MAGRHSELVRQGGVVAHHFGQLVFTSAIKALQEKYGSRRQYERMGRGSAAPNRLGHDETWFIQERDSFYLATVGEGGWPYVQHRGGPKGFLKVLDERTLAFADFRGNKQYVSTGNLATDSRAALILVDYPRQARLKILGRVEVAEGDAAKPWLDRVADIRYQAVVERVYVIRIEAFDWNCPQHIIPRFTAQEIQEALAPVQKHIDELEKENLALRSAVRATSSTSAG